MSNKKKIKQRRRWRRKNWGKKNKWKNRKIERRSLLTCIPTWQMRFHLTQRCAARCEKERFTCTQNSIFQVPGLEDEDAGAGNASYLPEDVDYWLFLFFLNNLFSYFFLFALFGLGRKKEYRMQSQRTQGNCTSDR